jgi:hypothetical protein
MRITRIASSSNSPRSSFSDFVRFVDERARSFRMALGSFGSWRRASAGNRVEIPKKLMRGLGAGALNGTNEMIAGELSLDDQRKPSPATFTIR